MLQVQSTASVQDTAGAIGTVGSVYRRLQVLQVKYTTSVQEIVDTTGTVCNQRPETAGSTGTVYNQCSADCRCYWYRRFSVQETATATGTVGSVYRRHNCVRYSRFSVQETQLIQIQSVQCTGDCNCYRYSTGCLQVLHI